MNLGVSVSPMSSQLVFYGFFARLLLGGPRSTFAPCRLSRLSGFPLFSLLTRLRRIGIRRGYTGGVRGRRKFAYGVILDSFEKGMFAGPPG